MRRASLRTRLLVALVGLSIGVLLITAVAAALIARANARQSAIDELRSETQGVADGFRAVMEQQAELRAAVQARRAEQPLRTDPDLAQQARDLRAQYLALREALAVIDASVFWLAPDGTVGSIDDFTEEIRRSFRLPGTEQGAAEVATFPPGISASDLPLDRLESGETVTGATGSLAFVARPIDTGDNGQLVVVLTQPIETRPFGAHSGLIGLAGGVALLVALLVAVFLAGRLTRPLRAMERTADRIAAGDLAARVELGRHPDDELASLARTLDAMASQLEAAKGLERAFLLSVSHDLRTPLTSIRGYAEAIADGAVEGDEERTRAATVIGSEARRLERLVADLLDLARLDAREFSLTPRPVDAAAVVGQAADAFGPAARELGLDLHVEVPASVAADLDPERLGQIVANLVENALKYARTTVEVTLLADPAAVTLHVDDDGPGVPADELARVFDRLYTGRGGPDGPEAPGRKVGTGIGLAIVRELAAAMGGTATATPRPGGGARFSVRLPRGSYPNGNATAVAGTDSPTDPPTGSPTSTSTSTSAGGSTSRRT